MKKMMVGSIAGLALGAGLTAFVLNNKKTKNKAVKLVNNALDHANNKLNMHK